MSAPALPLTTPLPLDLPDDVLFEVIHGQFVELPPMGAYESLLASLLGRLLGNFADEHQLGWVVVEVLFDLGLPKGCERRPDVAFVSYRRWPRNRPVPRQRAWPVVPELMVEIVSPTNTANGIQDKLDDYFAAGVQLVWVVYPEQRRVYIYASATHVGIVDIAGELDGGVVLPGFRLPLTKFLDEQPAQS